MALISMVVCGHCDFGIFQRVAGDTQTCDCGYVHLAQDGSVVCADTELFYQEYPGLSIVHSEQKLRQDFDEMVDRYGKVPHGKAMAVRLMDEKRSFKISKRRHFEDDLVQVASLTEE